MSVPGRSPEYLGSYDTSLGGTSQREISRPFPEGEKQNNAAHGEREVPDGIEIVSSHSQPIVDIEGIICGSHGGRRVTHITDWANRDCLF